MSPTIAAIVCAYNEARVLPACLHSLLAQTRPPDEILVINNASTDETGAVARAVPGVRVVDEPIKGLVVARETARLRGAQRHPRVRGRRLPRAAPVARAGRAALRRSPGAGRRDGPYRFYDWDWMGRLLVRAYDLRGGAPDARARALRASGSAPFSTAATSRSGATRSSGSAGSIARSSFTARTRTSAAG